MKTWVRRYPIGTFIAASFAFSWIIWIIAILFVPESSQIMWIVPGAYGPTVMAIVVTAVAGGASAVRRLLSKFLIWRVGISWYLIVAVVVVVIWGRERLSRRPLEEGETEISPYPTSRELQTSRG